jgi:hypothetical protein
MGTAGAGDMCSPLRQNNIARHCNWHALKTGITTGRCCIALYDDKTAHAMHLYV